MPLSQQMTFRLPPEVAEALEKHVPRGERNAWVVQAIRERLEREGVSRAEKKGE